MLGYLDTLIGFAVVMLGVSLIVTILTQVASSLFSHRGAELLRGLEVLFRQIDPKGTPVIQAKAKQLAEAVLTHPLASDSIFALNVFNLPDASLLARIARRWRLANAISASDLAAVLKSVADNPPAGVRPGLAAMLGAEINALLAALNPVAVRAAAMAVAVPGAAAVTPAGGSSEPAGNLDAMFDRIQDRVGQRFTMWMRCWTVTFSFSIAIFACLDSFDLAYRLYNNAGLRAQLVAAAPDTQKLADRVLGSDAKTPEDAVRNLYTRALQQAVKETGISQTPGTVASPADAEQFIGKVTDQALQAKLRATFDKDWHDAMRSNITDSQSAKTILTTAGALSFGLSNWTKPGDLPVDIVRRILGVLVSALLLSLGGPFWYNTLKSLVSLRPLLAAQQDTSKQSDSNN